MPTRSAANHRPDRPVKADHRHAGGEVTRGVTAHAARLGEARLSALERRVEELRTFEREYRTRLKSYLESQLRDLDASGRAEPANPNSDYAEAQQG